MSATKDRKAFIGGSDIAGIMGMSDWATPLSIWAIKTGLIAEKDLSDVEEVQTGIDLEDYVAKRFMKATGLKLRRDERDFTHPKFPYMQAHIDRWIVGEDALFEAKTTSAWNLKKWDGDSIPQPYILQVMWYCGILKKSVGYIAVLIGGQKFRWKKIDFDQELFDKMVETAKYFWEEFVEKKVAPMASADDNEEMVSLLFPKSGENILKISDHEAEVLNQLVEERQGGIEQKKIVEKELDEIEAKLKLMIGSNEALESGTYRASWKSQDRSYADGDKLKADNLWDKYSKTTSSRVLRTKKLEPEKEKKNAKRS
jgi:putative phage-type endonuclease